MKVFPLKRNLIIFGALSLLEIAVITYLSYWREGFWNAISNKQSDECLLLISIFLVVALILCFLNGYSGFIGNVSSQFLRVKLTKTILKHNGHGIEGHSQRVQEDCSEFPRLTIWLIQAFCVNVIKSIIYIVIIINQVPTNILGYMFGWVLLGTIVAFFIAKPLINLNFQNQAAEAQFRASLNVFDFTRAFRNNIALYQSTKKLQYFQAFFGQINVIIPYIIMIPYFMQGLITFGLLMQVAGLLISLTESVGFFISSFNDINRWLSSRKRLKAYGL